MELPGNSGLHLNLPPALHNMRCRHTHGIGINALAGPHMLMDHHSTRQTEGGCNVDEYPGKVSLLWPGTNRHTLSGLIHPAYLIEDFEYGLGFFNVIL